MKILLSIILFIIRIVVAVKILFWLVQESKYPELNTISDIEFYLVFLIFEIWLSTSINNIELPNKD
jgi:hypothetical protein